MYIKGLIIAGGAALAVGLLTGAGAASAATPAATVTSAGYVISAHVTHASGWDCELLDSGRVHHVNGSADGSGNIDLSLPPLAAGQYKISVVCNTDGGTSFYAPVTDKPVSLPASQTGGGGSLGPQTGGGSLGSL